MDYKNYNTETGLKRAYEKDVAEARTVRRLQVCEAAFNARLAEIRAEEKKLDHMLEELDTVSKERTDAGTADVFAPSEAPAAPKKRRGKNAGIHKP